ncbi:MAG: hypothetical protein HZC22_10385 [Rhodocyclales bacterium]|nr:hypothetical protein [Rhodocyclales bacterium]
MQSTKQEMPPLSEYVDSPEDVPEASPEVKRLFRTTDSVKYAYRHNRERMIASYAVIMPMGRLLYHPQRMMAVMLDIAKEAADKARGTSHE